MKPVGSHSDYEEDRDRDIMRVYRDIVCSCAHIRLGDIMTRLVNSPSRRFWVSEERAYIVMLFIMRGDSLEPMSPTKREMFREIHRRVCRMRALHPDRTINECTRLVIMQPAPKFYLTPGSAKVIIHRIKKRCYEERRQKLRHLF